MAIEREGGFQPERIPCAKTDGGRTPGNKQVPQHRTVVSVGEELKTQRLAGIAGAGNPHPGTGDGQDTHSVSRRLRERTGLNDLFYQFA